MSRYAARLRSGRDYMSRAFIVIYTGLLVGIGPASIDSYAPLQGLVRKSLDLTPEQALLGMSYLIFSMGFFQVFAGPLSDRFGRKTVILGGIFAFIAGSVTCVFAGSLEFLLAGRTMQGIGAAVGQVVGRAVLRDLYNGPDLAHANAGSIGTMSSVVFISPLASQLVATFGGWHAPFVIHLAFGILLLYLTTRIYKETLAKPDPKALKPMKIKNSLVALLRHPQSRTFLLVLIAGGTGMLSYVIGAQYVFEREYGITGFLFAALYCSIGLGVLVGQLLNRVLINSIGTLSTAALSISVTMVMVSLATAFSAAGLMNGCGFAFVIFMFAMGTMMCVANSMALVLDPHGSIAGFASSLLGFVSFVFASMIGTLLAGIYDGSATATLSGMAVAVLVMATLVLSWHWKTRHRTVRAKELHIDGRVEGRGKG